MFVATLRLELRVGECQTLRQRRRLLEEIVIKLRRHFNVSAAEDDRSTRPTEAALLVAAVGRSRRETRDVLLRVADAVGVHPLAEVVGQAIRDV